MQHKIGLWTAIALVLGAGLFGEGVAAAQARQYYPPTQPAAGPTAPARPASPRVMRSPRNQCRLGCRKAYQMNVRRFGGMASFRQRGVCYRTCARNFPPTPPGRL